MNVSQGDVFWVDFGVPRGSEPGFVRPCVVVQNNIFNRSRIATVVVCALTGNLRRAAAPGNVRLEAGEANLPERSVVNISQIFTVNRSDLTERIGALKSSRVSEIVSGIVLLVEPRDAYANAPE